MTVSFDRVAHIYDATRFMPSEAQERVADTIIRLAKVTPETRFIEPGIGTGRIALPLVQRGYDYTGVDISERMLAELRRKLRQGSNRLHLFKADATTLPFADASFDVAVSAHVLHLIPRWRRALSEIRRVLKSDGVFVYCKQERDASGVRNIFSQRWEEILAHHGVEAKPPGARKPEVMRALREQGAALETTVAATWRAPATSSELLDCYANRVHSPDWQVPDGIFGAAMRELRAWAEQRYPSAEARLADEVTMEITVARGWAAG